MNPALHCDLASPARSLLSLRETRRVFVDDLTMRTISKIGRCVCARVRASFSPREINRVREIVVLGADIKRALMPT